MNFRRLSKNKYSNKKGEYQGFKWFEDGLCPWNDKRINLLNHIEITNICTNVIAQNNRSEIGNLEDGRDIVTNFFVRL